jgi:AcrR family transcriptional regulator
MPRSAINIAKKPSRGGTSGAVRSPRPRDGKRAKGAAAAPRADRRNADTHDAILDAAARLIRRRGYNGVTIEAIAAAAGAGKQTIYRWWPTKADLYLELYTGLAAETKLKFDTGSVSGDLRFLLRRLFRIYAASPARAILAGLIAETQSDRRVTKALTAHLVRGRRHLIRAIFERGQARGEIRPGADLDFAVDTISGAVWFRLLLGHAALDNRFADKLVAQVRHGIAVR